MGPAGPLRRKYLASLLLEFPYLRAHDRLVKLFLALEVVIEQGFVHASGCGNGVGARPRQAVFGIDLLGSLQDGGPCLNAVPVSWRGLKFRFGESVSSFN